jgi:predicted CXXCH cytochrome family protein
MPPLVAAAALTVAAAVTAGGGPPPAHAAAPSGDGCTACHAAEPGLGHPVNVAPSMVVPAGLPLATGRVTCLTCHDPAALDRGGAALRSPPAAAGLCAACHDPLGTGRDQMHATSGRAHDGSDSAACLACHDGSVAADVGYRLGPPAGPPSWDRLATRHPIGVPQRPRYPGDTLRSPASLDRRIRLFDGKVECGSCHSVYAGTPGLLVMPNDGSRLCLACHAF